METARVQRSDYELIRWSTSEPGAFHEIVDRHFATIHQYLQRRVGLDLADDLSADVFAIAFARRGDVSLETASLRPWLYGIATMLVRKHWRSEKRRRRAYARASAEPGQGDDNDAVAGRLDARTYGSKLANALSAMPRGPRDALLLYALCDLSYAEIAVALDVPPGTVKTWIHRARQTARHYLDENGQASLLIAAAAGVNADG